MESIQILLLLCCCVYGALSANNFINKGQRAELFELTDNKMPTIKINMPDEDFSNLKDKATNFAVFDSEFSNNTSHIIEVYLKNIKEINFHEVYSECNVEYILPELQIGEDGYPQFDVEEILAGYDFSPERYANENTQTIVMAVLQSNKNFDLYSVVMRIVKMRMSDGVDQEKILKLLNGYEHKSKQEVMFFLYPFSEFKTKNATMTFELDGKEQSFDKVTFSLSGQYSREFSKPGYNVKIKGGKELYGRSSLKLRSDNIEPTYLRTKLMSDIHDHLGLKSLSANYAQLYINNEYMGLYILTDAYKLTWTEKVYGEKNSLNLYKCKNMYDLSPIYVGGCENENEDVTDDSEWIEFLTSVENAKSAEDLEDIFEIDHFLYEMAIEYLVIGWDHIKSSHNFYLYKQPNGKWIYLIHDFDLDIGAYPENSFELSFEDYAKPMHIMDLLIFNDSSRFDKILSDVVSNVFNPSTLYPHIDELKKFLRPYIELDKTPDTSGNLPGTINKKGRNTFSVEQWDAYSEFTPSEGDRYMFGLKHWILMKYRNVCKNYNLKCDPVYIDEEYQYSVVESLVPSKESVPQDLLSNTDLCLEFPRVSQSETTTDEFTTEIPTEIPTDIPTELSTELPTDYLNELPTELPTEKSTTLAHPIDTETPVEVDEPTLPAEDDSSSDEEINVEADMSDDEDSISDDEDTDTTTITITKTKRVAHATVSN